MNFFSHYYYYNKQGNDWYNTGLVLPDLLNNFNRKIKLKNNAARNFLPHEFDLKEGINGHFEGDRKFHTSEFFHHNTPLIKKTLVAHGFDSDKYRLSFVAHIMLELILDRVLIKKNETLLHDFYSALHAVDVNEIIKFVRYEQELDQRFADFFNGFRTHKYLYKYPDDEHFFFAANRIIGRVGLGFEKQDEPMLLQALQELEIIIARNYISLNTFLP